MAKEGPVRNEGRCGRAARQEPDGVVSSKASGLTPSRAYCAASSSRSGPVPASTTGPSGTSAFAFSRVCAAPAVITPGSVQPAMGKGRSSAPVAMRIVRAVTSSARPSPERATAKPSDRGSIITAEVRKRRSTGAAMKASAKGWPAA